MCDLNFKLYANDFSDGEMKRLFLRMRLVDTHSHLYLPEFSEDRGDMLNRAFEAGVERIYLPDIHQATSADLRKLATDWPERCFAMTGLHPCYVKPETYREELAHVEFSAASGGFCAIGEIGIDLYWDTSTRTIQEEAFLHQVQLAQNLHLPVAIHSREATDVILDLLEAHADKPVSGILHCFTGSIEQAHRAIRLGLHLGIGGVLTYKNSGLDQVVSHIRPEHIVLETDAPYLAPVPFRGKRNESAYIIQIANKLAEVWGKSPEEVGEITTQNALRVFQHE